MRIIMIAEYFLPGIGGLENSTAYLAGALQEQHDVELFTPMPCRSYTDDFSFPVKRFAAENSHSFRQMYDALCDGEPPDGVCFFGFSDKWIDAQLEFLGRVRKAYPGVKICVKIPTLAEFKKYINTPTRLKKVLDADVFVCPNPEIQQFLVVSGVPHSKTVYRPNGIPVDRFSPAGPEYKASFRKEKGLGPEDRLLFLFSGRFAARKRVGFLIKAFRQIPDVDLVLLGYFDNRFDNGGAFDLPDTGNVHVYGPVHDVLPWLQAADIMVSASMEEGMSNAILEGLAAGLPALVSDIPGHRELVKNGETGQLFEPDSTEELIQKIQWFEHNRYRLKEMGGTAREAVKSRFSISSVAGTYEQLIAGGGRT